MVSHQRAIVQRLLRFLIRLSRASLITAASSACAVLELWAFSSNLAVHELGIVLATQGTAALLAGVGEAGVSLWATQRMSRCATPARLTALSRYAMTARLPLFAVQAVLVAIAARYTLIGWDHFGLTLLMSASIAFSFGWIFIATERYLLIALTEGATRVAGLSAFLLMPSKSTDTALLCLAASGAAQSLVQLFAARQLGLLSTIPAPKLRRFRTHTRHFAAYRSALVQAVGRNILPVTVGAVVTPPVASAALATEKVSRAATGIVSAVLGYILPALGRGFRERPAAHIYGFNLLITFVVTGFTTAALMLYVRASQASLAQLFSDNTMLLVVAAFLTGARVVFSATLYMRVLAPGKFALASHLLMLQTVGAICASLLLHTSSSVVLFLLMLCAFDLTLSAAALQIGDRENQQHRKKI